jgi:hypothetical protein
MYPAFLPRVNDVRVTIPGQERIPEYGANMSTNAMTIVMMAEADSQNRVKHRNVRAVRALVLASFLFLGVVLVVVAGGLLGNGGMQ